MHFRITSDTRRLPTLIYGKYGRELSAFIPESIAWSQLNYGQGEGQALCLGCEWGFYINAIGIDIHIHKGIVTLENAVSFVRLVQEHVFGCNGMSSSISMEACDES